MSCEAKSFIEYYPGDNQSIRCVITDGDDNRLPDIITDTIEIQFVAKDSTGSNAISLTLTSGKITFLEENEQDVITIIFDTSDTQLAPGTYPVFMRLTLENPDRQYHVNMIVDGIPFNELVILEGGIS